MQYYALNYSSQKVFVHRILKLLNFSDGFRLILLICRYSVHSTAQKSVSELPQASTLKRG